MGARRKSRVIAFQTLYRYDLSGDPIHQLIDFSWLGKEKLKNVNEETRSFARHIIRGTLDNREEIDRLISGALENRKIERLAKVNLAILRISVFGLLYMKDTPPKVTIDEAVNIARDFGSEKSYSFINGVLDSINRKC